MEAFVFHDMEMSDHVFGSLSFAFIDIVPRGKIEEATTGFKFYDRNIIISLQNLTSFEETGRKDESNWKGLSDFGSEPFFD